ncbi:ABC transporter substrate-binding protein [Bdellovibrio sp. KM01]|uniref:substrate-binding periplasmic protein n=1 Tax=Bdellovibrio sp. KM01 TaxID=2748865 RepID=UPI0015EAC9BF|nr:transporter substrate-binding domain-containing protein [Bdellovibrio sp. KM01]QLY23794.1 transporter substrate-binding domain-containing protein [Bdellovibrio sp. KM01]
MLKLWFAIFLLSSTAQAQKFFARSTPSCERRYVVTFLGTPPAYIVEKGIKSGSAYEVVVELMRRVGCKYTEEPASYSAARENFIHNRSDVFGFAVPDATMDKYGEFVEMLKFPRSLVVNKKVLKANPSFEAVLNDHSVSFGGLISGRYFFTNEEIQRLRQSSRLREVPTPADIFSALIAGRVQATLTVPIYTHYYLSRSKQRENFEVLSDDSGSWTSVGFYLSHKRLSEKERERLKKLISKIREDGTLQKIQRKYNDPLDLKFYKPTQLMSLAWPDL